MGKLNAKVASERIRTLIDQKCGGSQQVFADTCEVSKNSVSQWVNGVSAPGNVSAVKIARVFAVDPLWVMGENVPMYKERFNRTAELAPEEEDMIFKYRLLTQTHREMVRELVNSLYRTDGDFR